jgi:phosphoribosylanthranilate isomerase
MAAKVKICGITNVEDALMAVEAGADMLGFVFYEKSPRFVNVMQAAAITAQLPAHVLRVGVFVNPSEDRVRAAIGKCGLNLLQFHGEEGPEFYQRFGLPVIKAFRIKDQSSLDEISRHPSDAYLLDSFDPAQLGGTGKAFNWDIAAVALELARPIILAGGLTPENVAGAIERAKPFAVDVSSGVEASPGRKDPAKVSAFIRAAKNI